MRKSWLNCLILAGLCLAPATVLADPYGPSWTPEIGWEAGLTAGGGNLIDPGVTGQPANTPSNVYLFAGNTFYLQGYYRQAIGRTGLSVKAAAGGSYACMLPSCIDVIVTAWAGGDIGTYQFDNFAGDLALEYAWDDARIGAGRTFRVTNYLISNSGANPFKDVHLKPAQGWFVECEWGKTGLRYTHVIYRSSVSGMTVNGSNIGLYMHLSFNDEDWVPGGEIFDRGEAMARESFALMTHPKEWSF